MTPAMFSSTVYYQVLMAARRTVRGFIALEYLEGKTLKHVISRRPMELERMLTVAIEVALPN